MDLSSNLEQVKDRIAKAATAVGKNPQDITLVAVSKYASMEAVQGLIDLGHMDFGENRVQNGLAKIETFGDDIRWHLIGRIQTNKVKFLSPFYLIHSLDRWKLAEKLSQHALKRGTEFQCLVQVNVANDPAKAGIMLEETEDFVLAAAELDGLRIRGLMTITALDAGQQQTRAWFDTMAVKFEQMGQKDLPANSEMKWLSMGMSADYELAIAAGANMVRVGSAIFAEEGD